MLRSRVIRNSRRPRKNKLWNAALAPATWSLPAAISGIVAAMILAISRAIGETMIVALAAGATAGSLFTLNPLGPGQTLTGAMASLAAGSDQVAGNNAAFQSLFFLGLLLFLMTLGLNILGDSFVRRTRQKY